MNPLIFGVLAGASAGLIKPYGLYATLPATGFGIYQVAKKNWTPGQAALSIGSGLAAMLGVNLIMPRPLIGTQTRQIGSIPMERMDAPYL